MISKKEKKFIIISMISLVLVAVISITCVFMFRKNKNKQQSSPVSEQVNFILSNFSNKAIADGVIPYNYNGIYKFSNIKDIDFSDKLTVQEINALYKNKNVKNKNELFDLLKQEKTKASEINGELLVLYNGNINKTVGGDKNPKPVLNSDGYYVGDDNLAFVRISSTNETFYISLNYKSKDSAIQPNENTSQDGTKLYVFKKIYSKYDPDLVLINITYEYNLHIIEEEINEEIYDFWIRRIKPWKNFYQI